MFKYMLISFTVLFLYIPLVAKDGDLDSSYANSGKTAVNLHYSKDYAKSIVIQNDDRIVQVGASDSKLSFCRYNNDGSLDTTFNASGKLFSSYYTNNFNDIYIAMQGNKIITLRTPSYQKIILQRLDTHGIIDFSFGTDSEIVEDQQNYYPSSLLIQPLDNKIITSIVDRIHGVSYIKRYDADGALDTSFDSDGIVYINKRVTDTVLQSDGKIVASLFDFSPSGPTEAILLRLDSNGSYDSTFGNNAIAELNVSDYHYPYSIAMQNDKIIMVSKPQDDTITLTRYDSNGSIDTSFATNGKVSTQLDFNTTDDVKMAIDSDNIYVVTGSDKNAPIYNSFYLLNYSSEGVLDTSFDSNGIVEKTYETHALLIVKDIKIDKYNKIVISGYYNMDTTSTDDKINNNDFFLTRYNADGTEDTSLIPYAKVTTNIHKSRDWVHDSVVDANENTITVGTSDSKLAIAKFLPDGSLDTGFGVHGKILDFINTTMGVDLKAVTIDNNGKIIVAGSTISDNGDSNITLQRYESDGSIDNSFGNYGTVITDFGSRIDAAYDLTIDKNGKIIVVGSSVDTNYADADVAIARYDGNGSLDLSFNGSGMVLSDIDTGSFDSGVSVEIDKNDKIVVGASALKYDENFGYSNFALLRYLPDGTLDTSLDGDGIVMSDFNSHYDNPAKLLIQKDGKMLLIGSAEDNNSDKDFALVRYNTDGSLDTSFGNSGFVVQDFNTSLDEAHDAVLLKDGKIIVAGAETDSANHTDFALLRFNKNGSLDTAFANGGKENASFDSLSYESAMSISLQKDGNIIAAGQRGISGKSDVALMRFKNSNKTDASIIPVISYILGL